MDTNTPGCGCDLPPVQVSHIACRRQESVRAVRPAAQLKRLDLSFGRGCSRDAIAKNHLAGSRRELSLAGSLNSSRFQYLADSARLVSGFELRKYLVSNKLWQVSVVVMEIRSRDARLAVASRKS